MRPPLKTRHAFGSSRRWPMPITLHTPLMIIHSENDFRVPISDGEQLFSAIKLRGGEVEFIRYPRDGHELSRSGEPEHRVSRLQHMLAWFDKYCQRQRQNKEQLSTDCHVIKMRPRSEM